MSVLLKEIRNINKDAARVLEGADYVTDSDIQSLTREDLNELFPGHQKLKLRRTIFDKIHKQKPVDVLIRELKDFIPHESLRAALTNNGVLVDYLRILKEMKTQMNNVQGFLDAHIDLLEQISKDPSEQESGKGISTSASCGPLSYNGQTSDFAQDWEDCSPVVPHAGPAGSHPQSPPRSTFRSTPQDFVEVNYQLVVSGQTFGAHLQLMAKVKGQGLDQVRAVESRDNGQITIVFCPISSRVGSDVDAAMTDVQGDKPVILVLMHHERQPRFTAANKTWNTYPNIVFHVNVFYHETMRGLLSCEENNVAAAQIRGKLLEYSPQRRERETSGNAPGVGAESGRSHTTPAGSGIKLFWPFTGK